MMMATVHRKLAGVAMALALGTAGGAAQATLYTFNFASPTGDLGTQETYTNNGVSITAYGFEGLFDSTRLWGKNAGGDEKGLGIKNEDDHEIDTHNFVQLSMSNLWSQSPTSLSMSIGSVQSGESWRIYGSNVLGSLGTLLLTGTTDAPAMFGVTPMPAGYAYLGVRAGSGNVLLSSLSANTAPVPEPGSLALLASGLLAVVAMGGRRRTQS
jgi:hypothetical protein